MSEALKDYYDALERLKRRRAKINNDTVALEAGRKKGSIKKSREIFADLILAIDSASSEVAEERNLPQARLERIRDEKKSLQQRLDESLEREICLVRELFDLRRELAQIQTGKVVPIARRASKAPSS